MLVLLLVSLNGAGQDFLWFLIIYNNILDSLDHNLLFKIILNLMNLYFCHNLISILNNYFLSI